MLPADLPIQPRQALPPVAAEAAPQEPQADAGVPPPVAGLLQGKPPALQILPDAAASGDPTIGFLQSNFDQLSSAGIDYTDLEDGRSVLFNSKLIDEASIQKAAAEGTLDSIAPPLGAPVPAAQQAQAPQKALSPDMVAPAKQPSLKQASVGELKPVIKARTDQVKARTPTEQPIPAGGFQNNLMKRPV